MDIYKYTKKTDDGKTIKSLHFFVKRHKFLIALSTKNWVPKKPFTFNKGSVYLGRLAFRLGKETK